MPSPTRLALHAAVTTFQAMRRAMWFFTRPRVLGVIALPLTPEGQVVLVKLTYSKGWRLPGGGRGKKEEAEAALLRELREEIGLEQHGELRHLYDFDHEPDFRRATTSVFAVSDVGYRFRRSIEIEEIGEFDPKRLPADSSEHTFEHVARALAALEAIARPGRDC